MNDKKKVFVIMPFQDEFFEMYDMLKMHFLQDYEFSNASDEGNQQNILQDIIEPLYSSDIIIADLTGLNANVMYELGIAHTFNKKTIVITKDKLSKLPFDLKTYRAKDYSTEYKKFTELLSYLDASMKGAETGEVLYSNPVKDFINTSPTIVSSNWFTDVPVQLPNDSDAGFLDFLAEIEENANTLTEDINELTKDINNMSNGISNCTKEINRVNKVGGSGTASFARKEAKKAATYVDEFSSKLRDHNETFEFVWDKIDKNTMGLLENEHATSSNNKDSLVKYLLSLKGTQKAIEKNNQSIGRVKTTLNDIMGYERYLTQAIRSLQEDLSGYLDKIERISLSIDKILAKSKFVVGDLPGET